MKQIINEFQSFDDLFIQGFKLCIKAENLIIDAIVHANKPFQLTEADNTDINAITDNIAKESINNADEIIQRIDGITTAVKLNTEGLVSPQFANFNEVNLLYQSYLQNIQNIKQKLNNEIFIRTMKQIEDNFRKLIIDKQNELHYAEVRLTDLYKKMMDFKKK
jgi:hypothetical protein